MIRLRVHGFIERLATASASPWTNGQGDVPKGTSG